MRQAGKTVSTLFAPPSMRPEAGACLSRPPPVIPGSHQTSAFHGVARMHNFTTLSHPLRDRSDVARLLGLSPNARRREIVSAFGRATGCEAWLSIEEEAVMAACQETWEVRVIQELPKCRVILRKDGRGKWLESPEAVPQDVLAFLQAREARNGTIVTDRSWKAWEKMRWAQGRGRRLRGRSGELHALVEIKDVRRPTGDMRSRLVIEALGAPFPEQVKPIQLDLPVTARQVDSAILALRHESEAQMEMVA